MGWWPFSRKYLDDTQEQALVAAIKAAEAHNRGEVRVHLERRCKGPGALERAAELFGQLEMGQTQDSTGVLLYVAIEDRKAAVFAGPGIHGAAEEGFWQRVIDQVAEGCGKQDLVGGLTGALAQIGALLRESAPGQDRAGNELPDAVTIA